MSEKLLSSAACGKESRFATLPAIASASPLCGHRHSIMATPTGVSFTAIFGSSISSPVAYLLTVKNRKLLLDCGWTEAFDPAVVAALQPYANSIDAVLLSKPDILHLGALPWLYKHGCKALAFSTLATHRMGQMFLYDAYQSKKVRAGEGGG